MPFPPTVPSTTLTPLTSAAGATSQSAWANAMQTAVTDTVAEVSATIDVLTDLDARVDDRWISARDYGAVSGGDGAVNRQALIDVVAAAIAGGRQIYLPAGTYPVTFTSGAPKLSVTDNLKIVGAGSARTVITFGPEVPAFAYSAFEVAAGKGLVVEGVTLTGPADPGTTASVTGPDVITFKHMGGSRRVTDAATTAASTTVTSATAAFVAADIGRYVSITAAGPDGTPHYSKIASVTDGTTAELVDSAPTATTGATLVLEYGGSLHLRDVVANGWWTVAVQAGDSYAGTTVTAVDCDFQAIGACVNGSGNPTAMTHKFIRCYRTKFRGKGITWATGQDHLAYPNPSTSVYFEDCEWYDSPGSGYCLHHFSDSAQVGARYGATFIRDYVDDTCSKGHLFSSVGRTGVKGGIVRSRTNGYSVRYHTRLEDVLFDRVASAMVWGVSAAASVDVECVGCQWDRNKVNMDMGSVATRRLRVIGGQSAGGYFDMSSATSASLHLTGGFKHTGLAAYTTRNGTASTAYGIRAGGGSFLLSGIITDGVWGTGSQEGYVMNSTDVWTGEYTGCQFLHTVGSVLGGRNNAANIARLVGRDSLVGAGALGPKAQSGVSYQLCTPRRCHGGDLTITTATITPTLNADIYTMSSTGSLDRVLMHDDTAVHAACTGTILRLRATHASGYTLRHDIGVVTGRIMTKTGADRAVALNEFVTLALSTDSVWYEVT